MRSIAFAVVLSLFAPFAAGQAQKAPSSYAPRIGQEGKDVVWVPTPQSLVDRMLDMAEVTAQDFVIDLGSGDGRTVITAAKRGARALGIEYNPEMVELAKQNAEKAGVSKQAEFRKADLFQTDFSEATVITMFLLPDINLRLRPKLLQLRPGTRIVSNTFTMGDWKPDETSEPGSCEGSWCTALLWIVPAPVEGTYKTPQGEVTFKRKFQELSGTMRTGGKTYALEGTVRGDAVTFKAGGKEYRGTVTGKHLDLR